MSLDDTALMQETLHRYLRIIARTGKDPVLQPPPVNDYPRSVENPNECWKLVRPKKTGARVPTGADRVVLQEHAERQDDRVVLTKPVEAGANIRLWGEDVRQGEHLLPKRTKLDARKVALLASQERP
ncbi:hypothetical protein [Bradyrhizobium prioriisuperbiae]|uniref:hypothetical protein n=1 Tax=Bradyrhizobium prioriisuperbiae TaxID=2854389 RepID=UPI0028EC36B5|nr:hypothetical protein [Bradyrhizobium prioritasuperba]